MRNNMEGEDNDVFRISKVSDVLVGGVVERICGRVDRE